MHFKRLNQARLLKLWKSEFESVILERHILTGGFNWLLPVLLVL